MFSTAHISGPYVRRFTVVEAEEETTRVHGFRAAMGEAPRRFLASNEYCGPGENASDEWFAIPSSTTEAALVASR